MKSIIALFAEAERPAGEPPLWAGVLILLFVATVAVLLAAAAP